MLHDAALVFGKDIRIELRSRVALNQILPFALVVAILFGLALGPSRSVLQPATPGLFWVAVLLTAVLAVQRSFAVESADAARDGLRLSGLDPAGIFLGKALAVAAEMLVLELVLSLVVALLYGAHLSGLAVLVGSALLGTAGLAAVGILYGVLSSGLKVRDTLLPLLFLPIAAPVLLAATKAWGAGLSGHPGASSTWLAILGVFAVVYVAAGVVAFGPLLEEG